MNFTNVFYFYICRAVKLLAIEKKLAQQKENQMKREDDEQAAGTRTTDEGRGTQKSSRTSAIVARDSMTAAKFQMKGTLNIKVRKRILKKNQM